ncbi:MAG TPA: M48 family metalloprotease [Gaiellaceae bacterium]|nr:M48 family metalloprotease [Gaiellaceae bacterium]
MIVASVGLWLAAAALLWRTSVPADLDLPHVDARQVLGPATLERAERYQRGLRLLWLGAVAAELAALGVIVWLSRRIRLRRLVAGVAIGAASLVAVWLVGAPFALAAHWWRRRYGISRSDYTTILVDPWLEWLGTLAAACVAIALLMLLARRLGHRWWLVGGPAFAALGAAFLLVQPFLLVPRLAPLHDPPLAAAIAKLAQRQGVGDVEVEVRDASRQTRVINAEFYGVGPTKRMILWDTALDGRLTRAELLALAGHEFGHVEARQVWKSIGWLALFAVPGAYLVARLTRRRGGLAQPAAVPLALLAFTALQLLLLPATNAISRRYEAEADWLSLRATDDPRAFEGLVRALASASLADPDPPRWAQIVLGTHPTSVERVAMSRAAALRAGS